MMTGELRHALLESGNIQTVEKASIAGELVSLGEYPGLRLSSETNSRVHGEWIDFASLDTIIDALDEEEGPGFKREIVNVTLDNGTSQFTWVYVLASHSGEFPVIASGDWRRR